MSFCQPQVPHEGSAGFIIMVLPRTSPKAWHQKIAAPPHALWLQITKRSRMLQPILRSRNQCCIALCAAGASPSGSASSFASSADITCPVRTTI